MTLDNISTDTDSAPPRVVIYGPHGIGKTTFGAQAPSPIFLRTEDGLKHSSLRRLPKFPIATSYSDVMQAMRTLYENEHPYKTLVVDSLDWLEPLIWKEVCFEKNVDNIEDFGYGKGYKHADEPWQRFLQGLSALNSQGMTIICLAHTNVKRFDAPDTPPYDRYTIKLHDRASALVQEWADVVGFAHWEVFTQSTDVGFNKDVSRGVGTGRRLLSLQERPAYLAKERYGLPPEVAFSWDAFVTAFPADPADAPAPSIDDALALTQPNHTEELIHAE